MAYNGSSIRAVLLVFALLFCSSVGNAEINGTLWSNTTTNLSAGTSGKAGVSNSSKLLTASTKASSDGLGAFVAAGMGMSRSASETTETSLLAESSGANTTAQATVTTSSSGASALITTPPISGDYTLSFTGDCWQQWSAYWSANSSASRAWTNIQVGMTTTKLFTDYSYDFTSSVISGTTTVTVYNGVHPQATYTTVAGVSTSFSAWSSPITTRLTSQTWSQWKSIDFFGNGTLIEPSCTLPSYVPQCQSSWEDWVYYKYASRTLTKPEGCTSNVYASSQAPSCSGPVASWQSEDDRLISLAIRPSPSCTQAAVTGSVCSTLVDAFLRNEQYYGHQSEGVVGGGMNWTTITTTTTKGTEQETATITTNNFFWDPSYAFAPGCSLGCQSCQINGGTVQLIYWPPASSTWINGNYSAITRNSSDKATIVTLGTTLTSPTVYVSFDSLYARDSCSLFGKTHYDQIVAITNTANLSSLYGWGRYNGLGSPASFNFTDLYVTPVPDYIYQSQPRCASSYAMFDPRRGNQLTMPANWTCPRTAPYDPILSIPMEVRDLDPDWANCIGGINGVYDPPIALTPADSIAKPTVPAGNPDTTTDAAPASTPKPTDPPVTSKPEPAKPSDTSLPENQDPEPSTGDPQTVDSGDKPTMTAGKPANGDGEVSGGTLQQPKPTSSPDAAPGSDASDDPAANDQGNTDDGPKQQAGNDPPASNGQSSADDHPTQPAGSGPAPTLDSPDNKPATTNALSVLASAEASAKGEQYPPANDANPADSDSSSDGQSREAEPSPGNSPAHQTQAVNDPSDPEPFTGQSGPSQGSPTAMVASLQGGGSATIKQAGESIIIAQDGLSAAVTQGGAATIGTHVYSAAPGGGAVVVDSSATHFIGAQAVPVAGATSLTVNGQVITASRQGNGVILADGTQTITAQPGSPQTFGSQTVQIKSEGAELAIGTATFAIPNKAIQSAAESTAVWTKDGSTFTAISQGSSIILEAPDATITMSPGTVATFAGEQISVASADGILVHGGQTASFKSADANGASNDEAHVVSADGDSVVIQEGSRTLTMSAGQATVIDGKTLSAASTGGAVVMVDAGRTSTLSKQATSDDEVLASADGSSIIVKDGSRTLTLTPGQTTVVGGKTFIAQASGSAMVVAEDDATSTVPVQTIEDSSSETATGTSSTALDPTETSSGSETDAASSDSAAARLSSGASLAGSVVGSVMLLLLMLML